MSGSKFSGIAVAKANRAALQNQTEEGSLVAAFRSGDDDGGGGKALPPREEALLRELRASLVMARFFCEGFVGGSWEVLRETPPRPREYHLHTAPRHIRFPCKRANAQTRKRANAQTRKRAKDLSIFISSNRNPDYLWVQAPSLISQGQNP